MKMVVYGVELDTNIKDEVRKLRSSIAIACSDAFVALRKIGRFTKSQFDILVNEAARGRLNPENEREVKRVADAVLRINSLGIDSRGIVLLRSLCFSFDDILGIAESKQNIDEVVEGLGIEDAEIETVYGVTSMKVKNWYIPYKEMKKVVLA